MTFKTLFRSPFKIKTSGKLVPCCHGNCLGHSLSDGGGGGGGGEVTLRLLLEQLKFQPRLDTISHFKALGWTCDLILRPRAN